MLHRYLGDKDFQKGMSLYLNRHKYGNTQTEDLWAALEEASQKPVGNVMKTWTKQKGFPVINVAQTQDGNNRVLKLSQEKFCADGKIPAEEANTTWMVPISVSTSAKPGEVVAETLFDSKTTELVVPNVGPNDWVKLNVGAVGVFRVQYTEEALAQLLPSIENKTLPPLDRLNLQNDLFALVAAGRVSTTEILKLLNAFVNEDEYVVWSSISQTLGKLNVLFAYTDFQEAFHVFGRKLLAKINAKLGWEPVRGESHTDALLRALVISRLVSFEDPQVLDEARKRFDAHVAGTAVIPADLRGPVYRAVASRCDDKTYDQLLKIYRESELQEEKNRVSNSLGGAKDEHRLEQVLEFALGKEVRSQDSVSVVVSASVSKVGRDLAWGFFQKNKDEFAKRYDGGFLIARLVKSITEDFASEERAQEVTSFFATNNFPGTERVVNQSVETIRNNASWLGRDANDCRAFIAKAIA